MRILLVSQMYPGPDAPELGSFVATLEHALEARGHEFALAVAARVLRLDQATGHLVERGRKWSFFRGGG